MEWILEVRLTHVYFRSRLLEIQSETATGSPVEVAFVERDFTAKILRKNRNGVTPKGGNYGEPNGFNHARITVRTTDPQR